MSPAGIPTVTIGFPIPNTPCGIFSLRIYWNNSGQLWPTITPVSPATTWGPLAIIFIVSASKEAWDDYNRYLSDKKVNERRIWVVKDGIRRQIKAREIHVGNIVWLHENDEIPCDLVLIGTSDPQGICYVEDMLEFLFV
ncbi:Phospholipid-transporting ATPase 2 [Triticum urartu]|uniref:Phospholipid-transporting ATPase 2 n=1 Tax=Triticum urartu TaxID=4572 RepID=M8AZ94_TRIUA|nr:Phospholipid-transporting ATPase 2 [Triticum urartu]